MKQKKLFSSLLFLFLALLLLGTSTYAWLSMYNTPDVSDVIIPVGEYDVEIILEIKKNNDDFVIIENDTIMNQVMSNSVPGDIFYYRIIINNQSTSNLKVTVKAKDIISQTSDESYDMRNVFYLVDGIIYVNGVGMEPISPNDPNPISIYDQNLNLYRMNNIIDASNTLSLTVDSLLEYQGSLTIEFMLHYDDFTSAMGYQEGILSINTFMIYYDV